MIALLIVSIVINIICIGIVFNETIKISFVLKNFTDQYYKRRISRTTKSTALKFDQVEIDFKKSENIS